jgi:hypothetical protein
MDGRSPYISADNSQAFRSASSTLLSDFLGVIPFERVVDGLRIVATGRARAGARGSQAKL